MEKMDKEREWPDYSEWKERDEEELDNGLESLLERWDDNEEERWEMYCETLRRDWEEEDSKKKDESRDELIEEWEDSRKERWRNFLRGKGFEIDD